MISHRQTDDPLLKPPIQSSAHIHSTIPLDTILNPTKDDKQPSFSSPRRTSSSIAPMSNINPYFQHGGGSSDSRPHPPAISPIKSNFGTRSISSASNGSTGQVTVTRLPGQEQQYRDYMSGAFNADAENSQLSGHHSTFNSFVSSSKLTQDDHVEHGAKPVIEVIIDPKIGSRRQAEKRKANSDASRRLRHRKKNEAILTQKVDQLTKERDFYRKEMIFYKYMLSEQIGTAQMPARPASPAQLASSPSNQPSPADSHRAVDMEEEQITME